MVSNLQKCNLNVGQVPDHNDTKVANLTETLITRIDEMFRLHWALFRIYTIPDYRCMRRCISFEYLTWALTLTFSCLWSDETFHGGIQNTRLISTQCGRRPVSLICKFITTPCEHYLAKISYARWCWCVGYVTRCEMLIWRLVAHTARGVGWLVSGWSGVHPCFVFCTICH